MNYRAQIDALFDEQLLSWEEAAKNYKALESVLIKEIGLKNFLFKVQFNPARIVSSSAKVDNKSIMERKCFLCKENRPVVQKGIDYTYNDDPVHSYSILINPFPIFPRHLTIPLKEHVPQLIGGRMGDMVALSKELEGYTLFYNGPKCGASAPDHFHFQAGNRGFLTIEQELSSMEKRVITTTHQGSISSVKSPFTGLFLIESGNPANAVELFEKLFSVLPQKEGEQEPMVNIICWFDNGSYTILLFAREKHRPSHYFAAGESNILLSPASVDLGGVFITPLEKDFNKLSGELIAEILEEICIDEEQNLKIIDNLIKVL